jgi:hypothetical protein
MYPSPPQAFFNSTISTPNEGWFLDSGASHHVTADLNNLTSFRAYDGQDRLKLVMALTLSFKIKVIVLFLLHMVL